MLAAAEAVVRPGDRACDLSGLQDNRRGCRRDAQWLSGTQGFHQQSFLVIKSAALWDGCLRRTVKNGSISNRHCCAAKAGTYRRGAALKSQSEHCRHARSWKTHSPLVSYTGSSCCRWRRGDQFPFGLRDPTQPWQARIGVIGCGVVLGAFAIAVAGFAKMIGLDPEHRFMLDDLWDG